MNEELEKMYDQYGKDDGIKEALTVTDYAVLMKDVLVKLQDSVEMLDATVIQVPHLTNLIKTANDYMFYLEDNRRVIL